MLKTKNYFELKATGQEGAFSGRASVYGVVDYQNDVVMPGAFTNSLASSIGGLAAGTVPVLVEHAMRDSIGLAKIVDSTDALLVDEGLLILDLASAKEAYIRLKNKLATGLSIGYETVKETYKNGIRQLLEVKLYEVSLCAFPANDYARVTGVKSHEGLEDTFNLIAEVKAGRTISAANMSKLRDALAGITTAMDSMQSVIDAAEGGDKSAYEVEIKSLTDLMADIRQVI